MEFAVTVIIISLSGVLSPGPLLLSNIIHANKHGYKAGLMIAYGHTMVELPLVLLLGISSITLEVFKQSNTIIGIIGGIALISFALLSIIHRNKQPNIIHKPIISGIVFTAFNPFFITWWLTIGMKLINDSLTIINSINGILIMFMLHIWLDYAWLILTAYLTKKGVSMLDSKYYKYLLLILNILMIYFGIIFITTSYNMFKHMPP